MTEITLPNPPDLPGDGFVEHSPELDIQRMLTHEFILTQPVNITLTPRAKVKRPSGGFVWESQPDRDLQVMRLIEINTVGGAGGPYTGSDGQIRETQFMLLGEWDALLGRFDIFELENGRWWEVAEVLHFNGWERRASVIQYG